MFQDNRFTKLVRITEDNLDYLKRIKSKRSIAATLEEILNNHKDNYEFK